MVLPSRNLGLLKFIISPSLPLSFYSQPDKVRSWEVKNSKAQFRGQIIYSDNVIISTMLSMSQVLLQFLPLVCLFYITVFSVYVCMFNNFALVFQ